MRGTAAYSKVILGDNLDQFVDFGLNDLNDMHRLQVVSVALLSLYFLLHLLFEHILLIHRVIRRESRLFRPIVAWIWSGMRSRHRMVVYTVACKPR